MQKHLVKMALGKNVCYSFCTEACLSWLKTSASAPFVRGGEEGLVVSGQGSFSVGGCVTALVQRPKWYCVRGS